MGTHPIFESDFDCLTVMSVCDVLRQRKRKSCELDKDDEDVEVKRGRLGNDDEQSPEPIETANVAVNDEDVDDTNNATNSTEADESNGISNPTNISDFKR